MRVVSTVDRLFCRRLRVDRLHSRPVVLHRIWKHQLDGDRREWRCGPRRTGNGKPKSERESSSTHHFGRPGKLCFLTPWSLRLTTLLPRARGLRLIHRNGVLLQADASVTVKHRTETRQGRLRP